MSLILDALRKLERERDPSRPPGVLVVGSVPWGETSRGRRVALVAGAAAVLALAALAGWMLRPVAKPQAPAAPASAPPPEAPRPAALPPPEAITLPSTEATPEAPPPIRLSGPLPTPRPRAAPAVAAPLAAETPEREGSAPARPGADAAERSVRPEPVPAAATPRAASSATAQPAPHAASDAVREPSSSGAVPLGPAAELRLNAISQRDGRPVALINDRLVFEGDSFDGVRVIRIGDAEVEVEVNGERRVLRF